MSNGAAQIAPSTLLAALITNLDHHFFLSARASAKRLYSSLEDGENIPVMKLGFSDETELNCLLKLDQSEFVGKLNFSRFRQNLAMMMHTIKDTIDQEKPLNQMHSENGEVLFNIPGIIQEGDVANVMVCGLQQFNAGEAIIKLMFLDPIAYMESIEAARPHNGESGESGESGNKNNDQGSSDKENATP